MVFNSLFRTGHCFNQTTVAGTCDTGLPSNHAIRKPYAYESISGCDSNDPPLPVSTASVSSGDGASTKVVTFNIENCYTNKLYLSSLMKQLRIIAIQEHWLYSYEKRNMSDFCAEQGFSVALKSVDDDDPLLPTCRSRGKGGVCFIWSRELDSLVEIVHDGDSRMLLMLLRAQDCSICMINEYMPCRGLSNSDSDFRDTLDQVQEVFNKYCHAYSVILLGDLNALLTREVPNSRENILRKFCASQHLSMCEDYLVMSTFVHPNGKSRSQIDYILCVGNSGDSSVGDVKVCQDPLNTSTHFPVTCLMPPVVKRTTDCKPVGSARRKKVLWAKVDKANYQRTLATKLNPDCLKESSLDEVEMHLQKFCTKLVEAAVNNAPRVKPGKKKRLLSSDLQRAAADSKWARFQWKQAGKPAPEHPLSLQRKVLKKHLRTLQRQQQSEYKSSIFNNIMEANTSDRKLFYSLVNRRRKDGRSLLGRLVVYDVQLTTDEAIREGLSEVGYS